LTPARGVRGFAAPIRGDSDNMNTGVGAVCVGKNRIFSRHSPPGGQRRHVRARGRYAGIRPGVGAGRESWEVSRVAQKGNDRFVTCRATLSSGWTDQSAKAGFRLANTPPAHRGRFGTSTKPVALGFDPSSSAMRRQCQNRIGTILRCGQTSAVRLAPASLGRPRQLDLSNPNRSDRLTGRA
jgi:hypothetical protein